MNESHKLIKYSSENDITIYEYKPKENEKICESDSDNYFYLKLSTVILIFILILGFILLQNIITKKNNIQNIIESNINKDKNNIDQNNDINENNNNNINEFNNNLDEFNNNINEEGEMDNIIKNVKKFNDNSICDKFDPIYLFNLRIKNGPKIICENGESKHICYQNNNGDYNDIFWHQNGAICIMKNIILDPSKSEHTYLIYKGPVDSEKLGFPRLLKGFFNMKCKHPVELKNVNKIYEDYFNSWNYKYKKKEKIKELSPGKTIFFISRNQDSPNLYHGNSEIVNVIAMMNLFNLKPENIQVIFLESITIKKNDDPFYEIYKNVISRGGEPIYIKDLKNKYHISSAIHIPINWDSPCFFTQDSSIEISLPNCKNPSKTYKLYNDLVNKYLNISNFTDTFKSDNIIYYYPKSVIKNHKLKINFTKKVTIQWRKVWPKGRTGQGRLLGNGPKLADKLASILPKNILIRLVNTASLTMKQQIEIMRNTDYLVGIHGAGLSLSIFMSHKSIVHEILPSPNINVLRLMSALSGHKTYTDIINAEIKNDGNENVFFNVNEFGQSVLNHLKDNNFI